MLLNILKNARAKIENGWCQNAWAKNEYGTSVDYTSKNATSWCLVGALYSAAFELEPTAEESLKVFDLIMQELPDSRNPFTYNDLHTKEEVLAIYDRAIAKLEGRT